MVGPVSLPRIPSLPPHLLSQGQGSDSAVRTTPDLSDHSTARSLRERPLLQTNVFCLEVHKPPNSFALFFHLTAQELRLQPRGCSARQKSLLFFSQRTPGTLDLLCVCVCLSVYSPHTSTLGTEGRRAREGEDEGGTHRGRKKGEDKRDLRRCSMVMH